MRTLLRSIDRALMGKAHLISAQPWWYSWVWQPHKIPWGLSLSPLTAERWQGAASGTSAHLWYFMACIGGRPYAGRVPTAGRPLIFQRLYQPLCHRTLHLAVDELQDRQVGTIDLIDQDQIGLKCRGISGARRSAQQNLKRRQTDAAMSGWSSR